MENAILRGSKKKIILEMMHLTLYFCCCWRKHFKI